MLTGGRDELVKGWRHAGHAPVEWTIPGDDLKVLAVALDADERRGLAGNERGELRLLDLERARATPLVGHGHSVHAVAFLDRRRAVSAGTEGTIRRWDLVSCAPDRAQPRSSRVWALGRSPDGVHVPVARVDGVELWRLERDGRLTHLRTLTGPDCGWGRVWCVALAPAGDRVLVGTLLRGALRCDLQGRGPVRLDGQGDTWGVAFGADARPWTGGGGLSRHDAEGTAPVPLLPGGRTFALSADGRVAAVETEVRGVFELGRYSVASAGAGELTLTAGPVRLHGSAYTLSMSDDAALVGVAAPRYAVLWRPGPADPRPVPGGQTTVAVSPGGRRWAAGAADGLLVGSSDGGRPVAYSLAAVSDAASALLFLGEDELLVGTKRGALLRIQVEAR